MLQDLEFYENESMLNNIEINILRSELEADTEREEKERANSWTRIGASVGGAVGAATDLVLKSLTLGASTTAVLSSTATSTVKLGTRVALAPAAAAKKVVTRSTKSLTKTVKNPTKKLKKLKF